MLLFKLYITSIAVSAAIGFLLIIYDSLICNFKCDWVEKPAKIIFSYAFVNAVIVILGAAILHLWGIL